VGFSGGVKSAAIGLAGLATINANHTSMSDPDSRIGTYSTNPAPTGPRDSASGRTRRTNSPATPSERA
jgi:nickel-dependent lactate racemase